MIAKRSNVCLFSVDETSPVAFTAYADDDDSYEASEIIRFESVVSNIGLFYDATSSIFYCPHHGIYMFTIHIMSFNNEYMYARIMHEDDRLVSVDADDASGVYNQASNTVLVECHPYERVWVEASSCCGRLWSTSERFSTFSGFMVTRLS